MTTDDAPVFAPTPATGGPAHVLALMVAANGRIDERELQALDRLDAYRRVGVTRPHFVALARGALRWLGEGLARPGWMDPARSAGVDRLLAAVREPGQRLALARLGAAAIVADGRVTPDERLMLDRMLAGWGISQGRLSSAIRADPA